MGTFRILYGASTISLQAAVHPKYTLGALNMKEGGDMSSMLALTVQVIINLCSHFIKPHIKMFHIKLADLNRITLYYMYRFICAKNCLEI